MMMKEKKQSHQEVWILLLFQDLASQRLVYVHYCEEVPLPQLQPSGKGAL